MSALQSERPDTHFDIFTTVPDWFFADTLTGGFACHALASDIGMVQVTPMEEDLTATVEKLDRFLPFDPNHIRDLAARVIDLGCSAVLCDIAPMGIAVAREAGLPSVLIENFTWDWIYEGYAHLDGRIRSHVGYLHDLFGAADIHIQTRPFCVAQDAAHLVTGPVSRQPVNPPDTVRKALDVSLDEPIVLITMGGTAAELPVPPDLQRVRDVHFVVPSAIEEPARTGNVTRMPYRSSVYYPDLINACTIVVAKVGYSTVAEAYRLGTPMGFIPRPRFRESAILVQFVRDQMAGIEIPMVDLDSGRWLDRLPELLAFPRHQSVEENGGAPIARFLLSTLAH